MFSFIELFEFSCFSVSVLFSFSASILLSVLFVVSFVDVVFSVVVFEIFVDVFVLLEFVLLDVLFVFVCSFVEFVFVLFAISSLLFSTTSLLF